MLEGLMKVKKSTFAPSCIKLENYGSDFCIHKKKHNCHKIEWKNTIVAVNKATIQSEPFIRSKQDGCSDKTET
jgi:hypothetical protein